MKDVPNPSFEHNATLKKHMNNTGTWLLNGKSLKEWEAAPNSCLWLYGGGEI